MRETVWMYINAEVKKDGKWETVKSFAYPHNCPDGIPYAPTWPHGILWDIASGNRIKAVPGEEEDYAPVGYGTLGYAILKDLLDFNWDSKVDLAMCLFSEKEYRAYKRAADPVKDYTDNEYYINPCIPTRAKNLVILSEQQYLGLKKKNPKKVYAILIRIQSTYRELADPEWWKMVEEARIGR